jgi:hypothetical protein
LEYLGPHGYLPFHNAFPREEIQAVLHATYPTGELWNNKDVAHSFIQSIFKVAPSDRATAATLLQHPYLQ